MVCWVCIQLSVWTWRVFRTQLTFCVSNLDLQGRVWRKRAHRQQPRLFCFLSGEEGFERWVSDCGNLLHLNDSIHLCLQAVRIGWRYLIDLSIITWDCFVRPEHPTFSICPSLRSLPKDFRFYWQWAAVIDVLRLKIFCLFVRLCGFWVILLSLHPVQFWSELLSCYLGLIISEFSLFNWIGRSF